MILITRLCSVDLFPAAMVENPIKGGILGPTFSCIIGQTFSNLRRGDRFWYENPGQFTPSQLQVIRNTSLSRVLCDTSDGIRTMQPIVFLLPDEKRNPRVDCSKTDIIPQLDLTHWKQEPFKPFNFNSVSREDLIEIEAEDFIFELKGKNKRPVFYNSVLDAIGISSEDNSNNNGTLKYSSFPLKDDYYIKTLKQ